MIKDVKREKERKNKKEKKREKNELNVNTAKYNIINMKHGCRI